MKRYRSMLALLLAVVMLAGMVLSCGFTLRAGGTFLTKVFEEEDAGYETYTNDDVKFTLEYPAGYDIDEPYDNLVLISSGDDFRVVAEYAYTTADGNRFIYSAADFAAMIDADRQVLADWLGVSDFEVVNAGRGTVAGKECYEYDFAMVLNGNQCSGSLLIFDGQGSFGCYCLQAMINEDSPNADKYLEQQIHLVETFQVTGRYQEKGYTRTHIDKFDLDFISRRFNQGEYQIGSDRYRILPLKGVITDGNVYIYESPYGASETPGSVITGSTNYYFNNMDEAQFVTSPSPVDLGRYDYTAAQLRYLDTDGTWMNLIDVCFFHVNRYWLVTVAGSDEYIDQIMSFARDVLASLCFTDNRPEPATAGTK